MKTSFPLIYNQYSGLLNTLSNKNIKVDYTFNVLDAVTNVVYRNCAGNTVASFDYKHDILGLITQKISVINGIATTNSYTYDNLGRLRSEHTNLNPQTPNPTLYTYDLAGNRLSVGGSNVTYTHNKLDGVLHDTAGNITNMVQNGVTLDLIWNSQGQLLNVTTNGVFAESYSWGLLGNRITTTDASGTTYHAYNGDHCIADYTADGDLIASYTWGSGIDNLLVVTVYESSSTNTYYAVKDHLNSVYALIDESGNTVMTVGYDAWGTPDSSQFTVGSSRFRLRYLFQGREYSQSTGLYNFRTRWYSSDIGRWLSKDPIGLEGGLNLYVFCENNPMNYRDPWGEEVYYSDVGGAHAGLLYTDPNSSTGYSWFGFYGEGADYPTRNNTCSQNCTTGSKALFSKGKLDDNYGTLDKVKNDSVKLDTNCGEEQKLRDAIDNFDEGHYSFPTRNCAHVTRDMLHKSGFLSSPNLQGKIYSPKGLTKEVQSRNNMRAFARGWKELNRRTGARRSK